MIISMLVPMGILAEANLLSSKTDCNKEYSTNELSKRSKPSVVLISTLKSTGSGFVVSQINNETLILTNSHVIKRANRITVTRDKSFSAQFEHTIGITEEGNEIFTLSQNNTDFPRSF